MGWRNAGALNGAADIGCYYFFGGVLMNVAAVMEVSATPAFRLRYSLLTWSYSGLSEALFHALFLAPSALFG